MISKIDEYVNLYFPTYYYTILFSSKGGRELRPPFNPSALDLSPRFRVSALFYL